MASLNRLVSEVSHTLGRHNDYALREHVRGLIIHIRNELIRKSMENHSYVDAGLQQSYIVSVELNSDVGALISVNKVPRPVRLTNNLPFMRVATCKGQNSKEIAYIKDASAKYKKYLPGMTKCLSYDYIDDKLYIYVNDEASTSLTNDITEVLIQAPFEYPQLIEESDSLEYEKDDDEFFLPEDMIGAVKELLFKRDLLNYRTNVAANDANRATNNG